MNFSFNYWNGRIIITIDPNSKIKVLLNSFFVRINRLDLVNNWEKKYDFLYNSLSLHRFLESKVKDIISYNFSPIQVLELKNVIGS